MLRAFLLVIVGFVLTHTHLASAQKTGLAFDVATIKPGVCTDQHSNRSTEDQLISTNQPLRQLIVLAYAAQPYQVTAPAWTESACFTVTAKYPSGTQFSDRWLMMRTLLEERFHLRVHHSTKEMMGYALVVSKGGFKLKPADPGNGSTNGGNEGRVWTLRARKVEMSILAYELAESLGKVVVDMTGLPGVYTFQLRWAGDDMNSSITDDTGEAPSIFTALQTTLGLSLPYQKVPVDMIVVDRVDRVPVEN